MNTIQYGTINEAGFIRGMKRKGFNLNRSISELLQNSIDANAENIMFQKDKEYIRLIDDGNGMSQESLKNMWDVYRENHSDQESGGVSGLGSKPSTYIASKQTEIFVFTKSSNDKYYQAKVPWDMITNEQRFTGMVEITEMSLPEVNTFKEYISDTGTIIQFKYNHDLYDCIRIQFNNPESIVDISQRIDWIFAKFPSEIRLLTDESPQRQVLQKYNYFGGDPNDYYRIEEHTIKVFQKQNGAIVFAHMLGENNYEYYRKPNSRWTKASFEEFRECTPRGNIMFKCGLRKDDDYFDYSNPKLPGGSKKLLSYDRQYFSEGGQTCDMNGDEIKLSLWQPHLSRNSQNIGVIPSLPTLNPASGRSGGEPCLTANHLRTDINYNVYSSQNNIMDEIMGIQENKNQLNTYNMDQSFLRLIESLMKETGKKIWNDFQTRCYEFENENAESSEEESSEEEGIDVDVTVVAEEEVENVDVSEEEVENVDVSEEVENVDVSEEVENVDVSEEVENVDVSEEVENVDVSEEVKNVDVSEEVENVDVSEEVENVDSVDNEEGNNNTSSKEKLMRLWLEYYNSERDDENMNQRLLTILQTNTQ